MYIKRIIKSTISHKKAAQDCTRETQLRNCTMLCKYAKLHIAIHEELYAAIPCPRPRCIFMLHVHSVCPCCMSMSMVHVDGAIYAVSMLHGNATRQCFTSRLHFHAACPFCMSMLYVHVYICCMSCCISMLHIHASCSCFMYSTC
jgi:hypothetical protein